MRNLSMKPILREFEEMLVVGLASPFVSAMSPDANNLAVIPKLWGVYLKRSAEIQFRASRTDLGIVICPGPGAPKSHPDEKLYLAGTQVTPQGNIPPGMTCILVPKGLYAILTHRGPVQEIGRTMDFIFRVWLPGSGMTLRPAPHVEIYDGRFCSGEGKSEFDVCIPVERPV